MAVYWRDMYNINIPAINSERKLFFSILNQIENENFSRQRELADRFLHELVGKMEVVFKQEENLFKQYQCPSDLIALQEQEHSKLIKELKSLDQFNFKSTIEFIDILKTFIINHIVGTDLESGKYIRSSFVNRFIEFESYNSILKDLLDKHTLIQWNSYFEIGIPEIDKQHQSFAIVLNDLVMNYNIYTNQTLIHVVNELINYTKIHFVTEEAFMDEIKDFYPDYEKHIKDHKRFAIYLKNVSKNFIKINKNGSFEENEELLQELIKWLVEHVVGTDKEFAKIYHEHNKNKHI